MSQAAERIRIPVLEADAPRNPEGARRRVIGSLAPQVEGSHDG
ncbi:hypothetical protein FB465_7193 [Kitasatospora atroaurantiaca]|uniref:Uncharacterized protein n=1 Tax=Kitasatospora atroaurantiaca TaxID=285545 RepID=A0A561F242_9ACTN|nr:hypothetical protein FB465_0013 [Kitasatospora atroaurantiaca]TWE21936.1 hypothetical protein FB465_7193 [Kitasatospora atroaurantiaca]